jgi:hypothetical protein
MRLLIPQRRSFRRRGGAGAALLCLGAAAWALAAGVSCSRPEKPGRTAASPEAPEGSAYADPGVEKLVIARVGDDRFTIRDLDAKMRIQFPQFKEMRGPDAVLQRWEILQAMFDQALWVHVGEKRGVDRDPEFLDAVELSRRYLLANLTVKRLVHQLAKPTDAEVRSYYEENEDQFRQSARAVAEHILLGTREQAEGIRRRALAGEDFSRLVQQNTRDEATRHSGGNVGAVGTGSIIRGFDQVYPQLNQAIFATPAGGLTPPLETPRGWSLFRVREKKEASVTSLDEARESIVKKLEAKKANALHAEILQQVREESGAAIDTSAYQEYAFRVLGPEDLFRMAEAEARTSQRITWLRAVAERDPKGKRAAQALFLIGFAYAEDLRDYPRARSYFDRVIEGYAESELVPSARWMNENMENGAENLPEFDQIKRRAYGE